MNPLLLITLSLLLNICKGLPTTEGEEGILLPEEEVKQPDDQSTISVECPQGTLNEGWTVDEQYAFSDPLDCCGSRVSNWQFSESYSVRNLETGCTMKRNLLGRPVYQDIYPIFCSQDTECGDFSGEGSRMECCPEGYCLSKHVNGSSRCGEMPDIGSDGYGDYEYDYEDPIGDKALECYGKGLNTCMSCEKQCKEMTLASIDQETAETATPTRFRDRVHRRDKKYKKRHEEVLVFPQLHDRLKVRI